MLINIQFLRFAAAMLVVLYHSSAHLRSSGLDQGYLFGLGEAIGFAGVDIFFVISGFIMAWTTREDAGLLDASGFIRRRLARIYSGYWPFFLIAIVVFAWADPVFFQGSDLGRSSVLWPTNKLLLAVSWTLIFELYFYFCYTLLITLSLHRKMAVMVGVFLIVCGWSTYSEFFRGAYAQGELEYMSIAEYYMASPYMAEFIGGALAAGWLIRRPAGPGLLWLLAGVALFTSGAWWNNQFFDGHIEQGYWVFYRVLVFGAPSVLILVGLVRLENSGRAAPLRFSLLAGGASYAIYLSHTLVLTVSQHLGFNRWIGSTTPTIATIGFLILAGAILAYSMLHYRLAERPLHQFFLQIAGVGRKS